MLPDAGVPRHIDPGVPRERFMTGAGRGINRGGRNLQQVASVHVQLRPRRSTDVLPHAVCADIRIRVERGAAEMKQAIEAAARRPA